MPTLVEINMINKHMGLLKMKESKTTKCYPRRLTNLPIKAGKTSTHTQIKVE